MNREIKYNQELLVEGKDDFYVIIKLCERFKIAQNFNIIDSESYDKLLKGIRVRLKKSNIQTLGLIVDADENISYRWQAIKDIFRTEGYILPPVLNSDGLIIRSSDPEKPKIGIWLMPNNQENGVLENFIKFLIPEEDKLLPKAELALGSIELENLNKYKNIHRSKALVHTWLSWQEVPGTPLGQAITKRYLETDIPVCTNLVKWISLLFE